MTTPGTTTQKAGASSDTTPTQKPCDCEECLAMSDEKKLYYSYDLEVISRVIHNSSRAGIDRAEPVTPEFSNGPTCLSVVCPRNEAEQLAVGFFGADGSLALAVSDPTVEDTLDESTVILLSAREVQALRTLLDKVPMRERSVTSGV